VRAADAAGNVSGPANYKWSIKATAPPPPTITSAPANPTNQTTATFTFTDSQAGVTFVCQLDGSGFSACASGQTYSGLTVGSHTFSVKAQDSAGNQSSPTNYTWTIDSAVPPPTITSKPNNPTNQTGAAFTFTDADPTVTFRCQLDGSGFIDCVSPQSYSDLSVGGHTFSVIARDLSGNESAATSVSWTIDTIPPPTPTITSTPKNPSPQNKAFLCQLDNGPFVPCSSPQTYSNLSGGNQLHTFSVKAQDAAGNQSGIATFAWIIR
jgi:hypothetical protein